MDINMKLNGYQIIHESVTISSLPNDLINFLISNEGNKVNNQRNKTKNDIIKNHINNSKTLKEFAENSEFPWNKTLKFITDYNIIIVFSYRSGDYAGYSIKDSNIYDFNHDIGTFNILKKEEGGTKAINYKDWINLVRTEKRIDAWPKGETGYKI